MSMSMTMNAVLKSVLAGLVITLASSSLASAQSINQRQRWQDQRIERAFARGDLTHREAARLDARQREVARMERRFRSDGVFSPRERRIVQVELDALNRDIIRLTNNGRYRG